MHVEGEINVKGFLALSIPLHLSIALVTYAVCLLFTENCSLEMLHMKKVVSSYLRTRGNSFSLLVSVWMGLISHSYGVSQGRHPSQSHSAVPFEVKQKASDAHHREKRLPVKMAVSQVHS